MKNSDVIPRLVCFWLSILQSNFHCSFSGTERDFCFSLDYYCCYSSLFFRDLTASNNYHQPITWICLHSLHFRRIRTRSISFLYQFLKFVSVTPIIFMRTIAWEFVHLFQLKIDCFIFFRSLLFFSSVFFDIPCL